MLLAKTRRRNSTNDGYGPVRSNRKPQVDMQKTPKGSTRRTKKESIGKWVS